GIADIITPGITYTSMKTRAVSRGLHDVDGVDRQEILDYLLDQHANPTHPHEMQLADGRWILVAERKLPDGSTVGTRTDVTELKRRELALKKAAAEIDAKSLHLDTALENMTQGLCMFDANSRLMVVNQRYLDLYGFSSEIVKPGITLREILTYSVSLGNYTPEEAERALAEREARSTLAERSTVKQRLKDGRVIAVMNEPMSDGGTIATYTDISESERQARELQTYTSKLELSNRELEDFAYVASHDLQEPLRKIETFGDRLRQRYANELPDQGQLYIERMQDAAGRMRSLISDLLGYSRVTTKGKELVETDLNSILTDVLSDLSIRIEETKAEVNVDDLPPVYGDRTQLRQLFQNLIGNALKFSRPGVSPVVDVTVEDREDLFLFKIADNGIGFDNKFKDQIFTIFQRLHGRLEYEGTGVGLATVRKIVERHNGTIDADGRPDEGATFLIEIPKRTEDF
ncbi:MAG: PAS-domain containing protein, partial [Planctomycetota bacterium]